MQQKLTTTLSHTRQRPEQIQQHNVQPPVQNDFGWVKSGIPASEQEHIDTNACADWQLLHVFNVMWIMKGKTCGISI